MSDLAALPNCVWACAAQDAFPKMMTGVRSAPERWSRVERLMAQLPDDRHRLTYLWYADALGKAPDDGIFAIAYCTIMWQVTGCDKVADAECALGYADFVTQLPYALHIARIDAEIAEIRGFLLSYPEAS